MYVSKMNKSRTHDRNEEEEEEKNTNETHSNYIKNAKNKIISKILWTFHSASGLTTMKNLHDGITLEIVVGKKSSRRKLQ